MAVSEYARNWLRKGPLGDSLWVARDKLISEEQKVVDSERWVPLRVRRFRYHDSRAICIISVTL